MTVQKIAQLANVSIATVSRVLNNTGTVRPETAEAVMRAVEQLNGEGSSVALRRGPRQGARGKAEQGTTIAIVSLGHPHGPWFQMPVMSKVISGITREAQEQNLVVQIEGGSSPDKLGAELSARGVRGALTFLPSQVDPQALRALGRHIPVVRVMGEATDNDGVDHVRPDNAAIGAVAFDYLMSQGCREVAFLTANPDWDFNQVRWFGFHTRAHQCGAPDAPAAFVATTVEAVGNRYLPRPVTGPTLEAAVDAFVRSSPRPAGLFIPRDEETVTVYRLLAARGVVPGRDVTIVSCDNEEMRLSALDPRPASIELGTVEIGRWAVRRLLSRMRHPHEPATKIQPSPRLVQPGQSDTDDAASGVHGSDNSNQTGG
jgi:DNA-binding LacI/PurR family transcriptional regulator